MRGCRGLCAVYADIGMICEGYFSVLPVTRFVAGVTRFSGALRKTVGTSVLSKNLVHSSFIFDF